MYFSATKTDLTLEVRATLARMPTSVVVVTAYVGGRPWGVTASSFTSVCLDPPTVSICLFSHTAVAKAARLQGRMGISILGDDQVEVARAAAQPGSPKFLEFCCPERDGLSDLILAGPAMDRNWDPDLGIGAPPAPSVHGALAHFDCWVSGVLSVGDHDVLFGAVDAITTSGYGRSALLYCGRSYLSLDTITTQGE